MPVVVAPIWVWFPLWICMALHLDATHGTEDGTRLAMSTAHREQAFKSLQLSRRSLDIRTGITKKRPSCPASHCSRRGNSWSGKRLQKDQRLLISRLRLRSAMIEQELGCSLGVATHCRRIGPRTEASQVRKGKVHRCCMTLPHRV